MESFRDGLILEEEMEIAVGFGCGYAEKLSIRN